MSASPKNRCRAIVLASGNGSNFQAIIDAREAGHLNIDIVALLSDNPAAQARQRAEQCGIKALTIDYRKFPDKSDYHQQLLYHCQQQRPDLVILAGYMRILNTDFVSAFRHRILNIHPSLLPSFPGLNTYARVLANGDREHGSTVHFVTEDLDAGPMVIQARLEIAKEETESTLCQRVQKMEYRIYPLAIKWFSENRLRIKNSRAYLDENEGLPKIIDEVGRI